jgi:trimethylamine--corrinoid protein Co-methyltransferase
VSTKPFMKIVTDAQIEKIHQKAIDMLQNYGIDVREEECKNTLLEHGCKLIHNGRVQISPDLIDSMIAKNKKKIEFESLFGNKLTVEYGKHYSHTFGGASAIVDLDGNYRLATGQDLVQSYMLNDELEHLDMACALVYPSDLDDRMCQYLECMLPLVNSRKPVCGAALSHPGPAKYVAKLNDIITGGDMSKPRPLMTHVSPQSPFVWTAEDIDCVRSVCKSGVPTTLLTAPMAGLTSPMSIIGNVTQVHAEILAWGVWYYLVNPECAWIYAPRCYFPNMRNCQLSPGLPENAIASAIASQMANYYGFISDVNGGYITSCTSDVQIGYEKMMNCLMPAMAGATIVTGYGAIAGGTIYSPVQHVIDNEICGRVKKALEVIDLSDDYIFGEEALEDVVLEKNTFLEQMHTIEYMRKMFTPTVAFNGTWAEWSAMNAPDIKEVAATQAREIFARYEKPVLEDVNPALAKEINDLTKAAEKELLAT